MRLTCLSNLFSRLTLLFISVLLTYSSNVVSQTDNQDITNSRSERDIAAESVEQLLSQIRQVEAEQNTFAPALAELNFDLGVQLSLLGLHDEALDAFLHADQGIKAREGLYSDVREPVLRKIHEQQIALKEWDEAEVALENLAWLRARNLDAMSVEYVKTLQELVEWNLARDYYRVDASTEGSSDALRRALIDLGSIYEIYDENSLPYDARTLELAAATNHSSALRVNIVFNQNRLEVESNQRFIRQFAAAKLGCENQYGELESETSVTNCTRWAERHLRSRLPETLVYDPFRESTEIQQEELFFSRGYFRGKDLLLDQAQIYIDAEDHANAFDALLRLADWYLLFGHQGYAEDAYHAAWKFAVEQRLAGLVQMGTPKPISIASVITNLPELHSGNRQGSAEIKVSITSRGEVGDIELTHSDIDDEQVVAELLAEYSSYRYRPALHEGKPIDVDSYSLGTEFYY